MAAGTATDARGNPLNDVDVRVAELNGAFSQDTKTDEQGRYSMELDDGNYRVAAVVNTPEYNGEFYHLYLDPKDGDNNTEEPISEGIVEDFVWKISGLRSGADPNSTEGTDYYGGSIKHVILGDPATGGYADQDLLPEGRPSSSPLPRMGR